MKWYGISSYNEHGKNFYRIRIWHNNSTVYYVIPFVWNQSDQRCEHNDQPNRKTGQNEPEREQQSVTERNAQHPNALGTPAKMESGIVKIEAN